MSERRIPARTDEGSVLAIVLLVVIPIAVLAVLMMTTMSSVTEHVSFRSDDVRMEGTGVASLDLTALGMFTGFQATIGPDDGVMGPFRDYLDGRGLVSGQPLLSSAGVISGYLTPEEYQGQLVIDVAQLGFPLPPQGPAAIGEANLHDLRFSREDRAFWTIIRGTSSVSFGSDPWDRPVKTVESLYFVEGEKFDDFDFALLTHQVSCILCHAQIDTAQHYYDPQSHPEEWEDLKIGAIDEVRVREAEADTWLMGQIFTGGDVLDADGGAVDWQTATFKKATLTAGVQGLTDFSAATVGTLTEDELGRKNDMETSTASTTTSGTTGGVGGGTLGGGTGGMGGGTGGGEKTEESGVAELPVAMQIPSPFPDDDDDRHVDDVEFIRLAAEASGTLTSGAKMAVGAGSNYSGTTLPALDSVGTITFQHGGHLVLNGPAGSPLEIDGRVVVDGDVVIAGYVKGEGEIIARGNIYVLGPLLYDDGTSGTQRTYGTASDGTENRLVLAAGGSVLVGDFVPEGTASPPTVSSGGGEALTLGGDPLGTPSTPTGGGGWNFTICQMMLFNRAEWTKTQATLPGPGGTTVTNPLFDPEYQPRYYRLGESDDVYIYNGGATWFDPAAGTWVGQEYLEGWSDAGWEVLTPAHISSVGAEVTALMPQQGWLSGEQIEQIATVEASGFFGMPLEVDALLYTPNAVFFAVFDNSPYLGQAILNGSVVAAHAGILAPGPSAQAQGVGFRLNFDTRQTKGFLVHDNTRISLRKGMRIR